MLKRYWCFPILILLQVMLIGQIAESSRQFVLDLLYQYSPDGYYIVDTYIKEVKNGKDFMEYFNGGSTALLMDSFNVIVHETSHGYASEIKGYSSVYMFISREESIEVPLTDVFPSREMADFFPEELRTFRFDYINTGSQNLGTQLQGVYGLLDELNAYYLGTKTSYELLPYYLSQGKNADWGIFFNTVNGTLYAILEFKLYILNYLLFAREYSPEVYSGIMANSKFREAFIKIDRNAYLFINDYFSGKSGIYDHLQDLGYKVSETEGMLFFETAETIVGYGNFMDTYNLLAEELSKPVYNDLITEINNGRSVPSYPAVNLVKSPDMALIDAEEVTVTRHEHEYALDLESGGNNGSDRAVSVKNASDGPIPGGPGSVGSDLPEHPFLSGSDPERPGMTAGIPRITIFFRDKIGDVESFLVDLTAAQVNLYDTFAVFSLTLAGFPDKIMFNSPDLKSDDLEYSWSVEIDIEGDGTDDYSVSIDWFKPEGSKPLTAPVMESVQKGVWKIRTDIVELTDIPVNVEKRGNTLIFTLDLTSGSPVSRLSEDSRLSFIGYFNNGYRVQWDTMK